MCCGQSAARNWANCRRVFLRTSLQRRCTAEVQILLAIRCCVWTSSTIDHKLSDLALKGAGAGLPQTLQEIIYQLSDYMDPMDINRFSADL